MRLGDTNMALPDATNPDHTVVDAVDGHQVYADRCDCEYIDREAVAGADAVRAAVIDAYEERPPVSVRHVLLVNCERDWYDQTEDVIEIAGIYLDQDGMVLGDHSNSWWVTWVVGADCLVVLSRRGRVRVAPGGELLPSDTLLGVLCPRCGDAIGVDTMLDHDQAAVLRCRRCGLEVETESIPAEETGRSIPTAGIAIGWIRQLQGSGKPEPDRQPVPRPEPVRRRVLEW